MNFDQDRIFEALASDFAGQLSGTEKAALDAWRQETRANERLYQSCLVAWREMDPGVPPKAFDEINGWRNLQQRLSGDESGRGFQGGSMATGTVITHPRRWLKAAFPLAALVILGVLGIFLAEYRPFASGMTIVRTLPGEPTQVALDDGSIVELNGASTLAWRRSFSGKNRVVELQGQAFFRVASNGKPFLVKTPHAEVRVLGTQFDVWARLQKTKVRVTEGRVAVSVLGATEATTLTANQKIEVQGQQLGTIQAVDAIDKPAWLDRRLVFRGDLLEDVIADLESWFNTSIQLAEPSLATLQVTGSFQEPSLETVLSELAIALNLAYVQTNNGYLLSSE